MKELKKDPLLEALTEASKMDGEVKRTLSNIKNKDVTVGDFKAFILRGASWLHEQGCIAIEAEDDDKIYYYMPAGVPFDSFEKCLNYWSDREEKLKEIQSRIRRANVGIIINDGENNIPIPASTAPILDWELYAQRLELENNKAGAIRSVNKIETAVNASTNSEGSKNRGSGCLVLCLLALVIASAFFVVGLINFSALI